VLRIVSKNWQPSRLVTVVVVVMMMMMMMMMMIIIIEHEDTTVLWNQGIQTDREVVANRPDIIIKNKKDRTCMATDRWQHDFDWNKQQRVRMYP
jgi:hypothetical protein